MTHDDQLPESIRERLLRMKEMGDEDGAELDDADLDRIAGGAHSGSNVSYEFDIGVIGRGIRSRKGSP